MSKTADRPNNIIPIAPGYICIASAADRPGTSNSNVRLPVIGIAPRGDFHQAVVLDMEGRAAFSSGPVHVDGPSHGESTSSKALYEIAQALKQANTRR